MEIVIIISKGLLFLVGASVFVFTLKSFVFLSASKRGSIYLSRHAYNVDVNHSTTLKTSAMTVEKTDGLGISHKVVTAKKIKFTLKRFFKRLFTISTTRVSSFGGQSRPHALGWNASI